MSIRNHRHNNKLIDWRMLPFGLLSLAIGGVVSYSVGSNFGLGYVQIDQLPLTAEALASAHKAKPIAPEAPVSSVETEFAVTKPAAKPVEPVTRPTPAEVAASALVAPDSQTPIPTSVVNSSVAPTTISVQPTVSNEPASEPENNSLPVEQVGAEVVTAPESAPLEQATTSVVQSVSVDKDGNEIIKLSVNQTLLPESSDVGDLELPNTAEIVARANLAAGIELKPEEPELSFEEEVVEDSASEQEARFSTNPEDLPILRVIVPDAKTPLVTSEEPESEDSFGIYTEATLSREITDAVDSGVVTRVLKLIKKGEPLDGKDRAGQTMLLKAAWNGDEEMFNALLGLGANINVSSNDGRTPLFSATVSGNFELVRKLVSLGASVNSKTKEGKTPLMVSAWSNYPDIALYLMEQGAKPDLTDSNGRNALFYALWDRNIDVVRTLIQYGARLDQVDTEGHSAVDIARLRRIELPGMDLEAELKSIN